MAKAASLSQTVDTWNWLLLIALVVTAIAALGVAFATYKVITLQRDLNDAQAEVIAAKDRDLAATIAGMNADAEKFKAQANKDIEQARKDAAGANQSAAILEKDAATARLETEKIKQSVGWRTLSQQNATALIQVLGAKPGSVILQYTDGDPESLFLAIQLESILGKAKWQVAPQAAKISGILFGISLPDDNGEDARTLRSAFTAAQIPFGTAEPPPIGMAMGSTITGAPRLFIGSRKPPLP